MCSIGYVSSTQLYVGQQRVTATTAEDVDGTADSAGNAEEYKVDDKAKLLVEYIETNMSAEQMQKLLAERYGFLCIAHGVLQTVPVTCVLHLFGWCQKLKCVCCVAVTYYACVWWSRHVAAAVTCKKMERSLGKPT